MPQIPRYYSQGQMPVESLPKIPTSFAGQEAEALGQVGKAVSEVGFQLDQKLKGLKQVEEMAKWGTEGDRALLELHSQVTSAPEFFQDPEGAQQRFRAQADQVKNQYLKQITDPEVKIKWQAQFDRDALGREQEITHAARKQRIASGLGTGEQALFQYSDLAAKAGSDDEFKKYVGRGVGVIRALTAAGAYSPEQAVRREHSFVSAAVGNKAKWDVFNDPQGAYERLSKRQGIYSQLEENDIRPLLDLAEKRTEHLQNTNRSEQERNQREAEQQQLNSALKEMQSFFPGDVKAQADYAANTQNYPDMDVQKRGTLLSMINEEGQRLIRERDQTLKQVNKETMNLFLQKGMTEADIKASNADPEVKQRLIEINQKTNEQKYKTDPVVKGRVLSDIWAGRLTDRTQLLPYVGNGISSNEVEELGKSIDQAQDPSKSRYYSMADDLFKAKFKGSDALIREPEFLMLLDWHIKNENLKGPEIFKRASELVKPVEEGWLSGWFSDHYQFEDQLESPPWLNAPAEAPASAPGSKVRNPIPSPSGPASQVTESQRQTFDAIPVALRAQFSGMLRDAGAPVTDKNLMHLFEQYRQQIGE